MKTWMKIALGSLLLPVVMVLLLGSYSFEYLPEILKLATGVFWVIIAAFLLWAGVEYFKDWQKRNQERKQRRVIQTEESATLSGEPTADSILYLRPFKVDEQYMSEIEYAGKQYNSVESVICRMVSDAGAPVAIGRPGEELQPLGAHRIYATDDTWKQKVTDYFEKAKLVILYVDFTEGVRWELENALSRYKDKLILIPKVYNQKESSIRQYLRLDPTAIFSVLYRFCVNRFLTKKGHRGPLYYQNWDVIIKPYVPSVKMNDKVSAVIFSGGKSIAFYAEKPTQEAQLNAIRDAIHTKLGTRMPQKLFVEKGEKPQLILYGDLGVQNIKYTKFYPFAMGQLEFFDRGLRYKNRFGFLKWNIDINEQYKTLNRYKKNQLLPYSDIREIRVEADNCLQLVLEEADGSLNLAIPPFHRDCVGALNNLLTQCIQEGRFSHALSQTLLQTYRQQASDYTKAFYFVEAAGILLGAVLMILGMSGSETAAFSLVVFGGIWNISIAILSYILSRNTDQWQVRLLGLVAVAVHMCLGFVSMGGAL